MRRLAAICGVILSSPTWLRDRATILSPFNIGLTAILVNGAIFLTAAMAFSEKRLIQSLLQQLDFGDVAAHILLIAVVIVLTLSIPLRFVGLIMGPRIFRYFDQLVLSGISPMRYEIGRVASQNLYFLVILGLLLPWLVLLMVLGGVSWPTFIANLFLVWLYCVMLSMVMAWLTVYMPEWIAAGLLSGLGLICCLLAFAPIPGQPMVVTPMPSLLRPLMFSEVFSFPGLWIRSYGSVFLSSVVVMSLFFAGSMLGVYLGPLFGLIRENSTFGEVVYSGDSRLKRRLRFRQHVQRPSELAFFYQNRGGSLLQFEGLLRWLAILMIIGILAAAGWLVHQGTFGLISAAGVAAYERLVLAFFISAQFIHGATLVLAIILYSQGRSTTYQQISVVPGWKLRVSQLDWAGFASVLVLSTGFTLIQGAVGAERFESAIAAAISSTTGTMEAQASASMAFQPSVLSIVGPQFYVDTTLITSICGVTLYLLQRVFCLRCWQKTMAAGIAGSVWFFVLSFVPMLAGLFLHNLAFGRLRGLFDWGEHLAMLSPLVAWMQRFRQVPKTFGADLSLAGFVVFQLICWLWLVWLLRRRSRRLRAEIDVFQLGGER